MVAFFDALGFACAKVLGNKRRNRIADGYKDQREHILYSHIVNGATLNPANLIDSSRFEVKTADATISLDPEHSYLVETRIIDGRKYLLIPADEDIEVNGFGVRVKGE